MATAADTSTSLPTIAILDAEAIETLAAALAGRVAELIPEPEPDRWLSSEEAAAYLKITVQTIWKLTAADAIPFTQDVPGGRCYFLRSQLDKWRLERAQGPWN